MIIFKYKSKLITFLILIKYQFKNLISSQKYYHLLYQYQQAGMQIDLSALQDFKLQDKEWINWEFKSQEYENIPLTFFNRFNKSQFKCCDLSVVPTRKEDQEFTVVEGNTRITNRDFISKNIKMGDRRKNNIASTRTFTKKQRRNLRTWHNQYKTKFKQITVKNDWTNMKNINKRDLSENIPKIGKININTIKTKGRLHKLNEKVQRVNWAPLGFKQNEEYKVQSVSTLADEELAEIATGLMNSEQPIRKSLVCSIEFLLALMTVRGGQYPWSILIEKEGNLLLFENYKAGYQQNELSYLDLFTTNENTTENMPSDESKIKEHCITATKYTQVFKDLLASGDYYEEQEQVEEQEGEQQEKQKEQQQQNQEPLQNIKKYVKIELDDIDIFTAVNIDGLKTKSDNSVQKCLIRTFVETGADGGWIQDIKKTQGTLVFQEYLSNSCSLQKWICEGRIAGIEMIKLGFIGFDKQKPKLINVTETTVKSLQNFISFKQAQCWPILKYILDLLYNCQSGQYIISRSPYTPLALKIYHLPPKQEEPEEAQA